MEESPAPQIHEEPKVFLEIVTGTHSAGKSTLLADLADHSLTPQLDEIQPLSDAYAPLRAGIIPLYLEGEQYDVPLVLCPEAATQYVTRIGRPELVTTDYSLHHQIGMETLAYEIVKEAGVYATELAQAYDPLPILGHCAVVLTDRFTVDGRAYSQLRVPDADQDAPEHISLELRRSAESGQMQLNEVPTRRMFNDFVAEHCDFVFMADHTDVDFEDNGLRLADTEFRNNIVGMIQYQYDRYARAALQTSLSGDRQQRVQQFYGANQYLIQRLYKKMLGTWFGP